MTVSNESLENHVKNLLALDGAKILFGGAPLTQNQTSEISNKINQKKSICHLSLTHTDILSPLQSLYLLNIS